METKLPRRRFTWKGCATARPDAVAELSSARRSDSCRGRERFEAAMAARGAAEEVGERGRKGCGSARDEVVERKREGLAGPCGGRKAAGTAFAAPARRDRSSLHGR